MEGRENAWRKRSPETACYSAKPSVDSNLRVSHFFLLFVMFVIVVPAVKLFGKAFEEYLCAPVPPELRRLCFGAGTTS